MYKIGIDIGGTFTDCIIMDDCGRSAIAKAPSNAADPAGGVMEALAAGCLSLGLAPANVLAHCDTFIHGCTIATNAMIERTGARTAFITTRGHEDLLLIGKANQKVAGLSELEIIHTSRLNRAEPPLVPRDRTFGVTERVTWNGEVLVPLREEEVAAIADDLVGRDIESVAVCLLWSFVNPAHERAVKEILAKKLPGVYCSLSSEVSPTLGEYERATAAVINAYVGPKVRRYLETLETSVRGAGYARPLLAMQSEGGTAYSEDTADRAVLTIDSGPVGGVAGCRWLGEQYGEPNLICTDVGGTSFDVGLIYRGEPQRQDEPVIAKYRFRIPKVDIRSIGAGGGSIAWLDVAGMLRVGPQSARAFPGPACYGRGGEVPTATDADLVLGYLNPDNFLGGALRLDKGRAEAAIAPLAGKMGRSVIETAHAINKIMNAQMADLIRKCTVERGFDPRDFALVAYGGAGPTHALHYGVDVGARAIYVLPNATVFSAFGMLTSPITHYAVLSRRTQSPYAAEKCAQLNAVIRSLADDIVGRFAREGVTQDRVEIVNSVTMRYIMQVHEVEVPVTEDHLTPENLESAVVPRFEARYRDIFGAGTDAAEAGTEIITCKVTGLLGRQFTLEDDAGARQPALAASEPLAAAKRVAYFEVGGQLRGFETAVIRGEDLAAGNVFDGPCIVERYGDAVVVPPGYRGDMDVHGTIRLARQPAGGDA